MASRPARAPLTTKSSLYAHCFPAFYACYLLKSIKTPDSQAVYIGSTPSPPRRIRQHNGELTQGARKTQSKRPWVMQMIVHGFPSRLAALQFEWAWQHPHKSRHLRDENDKPLFSRGARMVKPNIEVVQSMIRSHPFNLWPLHVKLFTEEARDIWCALLDRRAKPTSKKGRRDKVTDPPVATQYESHFPPGFTWSVELEGVDGRSGHASGSGRSGPLNVKDEHFSSLVWAKNTAVMSSANGISCAVCGDSVALGQEDPLNTTLCPHDGCLSVSHFDCLSKDFLSSPGQTLPEGPFTASSSTSTTSLPQHTFTQQSTIIPRGGNCPTCHKYTLWGDIIRGQYRRKADPEALPEKENADEDIDDGLASDDLFTSDSELGLEPTSRSSRQRSSKGKARACSDDDDQGVLVMPKKRGRKAKVAGDHGDSESGSGESFDLEVSSSSSDDLLATLLKPKRGKGKGNRAPREGVTGIHSKSRLQVNGASGVDEGGFPSVPTTARRRRRSKSISSDGESDLFLPDPVTPKAPKAKTNRSSSGGRKRMPPATVVESTVLEADALQTLTPKPRRRVGHPKHLDTAAEATVSSRLYSTATTIRGGVNSSALKTPRHFPLLGAHLTLSRTHSALLLPGSDSDSDLDGMEEYDFSTLGAAHMRVTKQVVNGRMREVWELNSNESGTRSASGESEAVVDEAVHAVEAEAEVGGNTHVRKASGGLLGVVSTEVSSRAESERGRRVVVIDSDSD